MQRTSVRVSKETVIKLHQLKQALARRGLPSTMDDVIARLLAVPEIQIERITGSLDIAVMAPPEKRNS